MAGISTQVMTLQLRVAEQQLVAGADDGAVALTALPTEKGQIKGQLLQLPVRALQKVPLTEVLSKTRDTTKNRRPMAARRRKP